MQQPVLPAYLIARWLLLLVLLAGAYFLSGFLVPALAALIIGLATWPVFRRIVQWCGGRTIPAATLALIGVILVLIVPLTLALSYAVQEASNFFAWALAANR
ncbi:MAG TPA: AI-2E family transporter, partial [Bordetella sp.]|nr:AI-2E family transporter [Bordetella sp.]